MPSSKTELLQSRAQVKSRPPTPKYTVSPSVTQGHLGPPSYWTMLTPSHLLRNQLLCKALTYCAVTSPSQPGSCRLKSKL